MSRPKQTLVIIHGGQAFKLTPASKSRFLADMLRSGVSVSKWPDYCEHLGEAISGELDESAFLLALTKEM